jgi:hypothetical protein
VHSGFDWSGSIWDGTRWTLVRNIQTLIGESEEKNEDDSLSFAEVEALYPDAAQKLVFFIGYDINVLSCYQMELSSKAQYSDLFDFIITDSGTLGIRHFSVGAHKCGAFGYWHEKENTWDTEPPTPPKKKVKEEISNADLGEEITIREADALYPDSVWRLAGKISELSDKFCAKQSKVPAQVAPIDVDNDFILMSIDLANQLRPPKFSTTPASIFHFYVGDTGNLLAIVTSIEGGGESIVL